LQAIIVADGDVSGLRLDDLRGHASDRLVIAADGGALKALGLGLRPDVVIGDADSLTADQLADLRARGMEVIVHPAHKDESDTELCVREALRRGADEIVIVGAFGGPRIEHAIANLLLLTLPELIGRDVRIVNGPSDIQVITGGTRESLQVVGVAGDYVSLLPLTERVDGVTTDGLRYPLAAATLDQGPTRGLSNELDSATATVSVTAGRLAVIHTARGDSVDG
jgi:thiamine pyrophosphokinase